MFKSVRIQNFRGFSDVKLENLAQINLITGMNNTGKTSLLEAIFLLLDPGDPGRTATLASHRGVDRISLEDPEPWEWLFRDKDATRPIQLEGHPSHAAYDGSQGALQLSISLVGSGFIPALSANGEAQSVGQLVDEVPAGASAPELHYEFRRSDGEVESTRLRLARGGMLFDRIRRRRPSESGEKRPFFMWDRHIVSGVDADRLSDLQALGREHELVSALQIVEPRLTRLLIRSRGGRSSVDAVLGRLPPVPLMYMGRGLSNLQTLISALLLADADVFLIDEFGSGLHHSVLAGLWKAIIRAAMDGNVQIFATTHSLEAIYAAVEGSKDQEGSLAFFRLEQRGEGIEVVKGEDSRLRAAARVGTELR